MYHYNTSGLPEVWLLNGYEERETTYGPAVAVHDLEGLHKVITESLLAKRSPLTGAEWRFLRVELDLSQRALGDILGVGDQAVASWEKNTKRPNLGAEKFFRGYCGEVLLGEFSQFNEINDLFRDIDNERHELELCLEEQGSLWRDTQRIA